MDISEQDIQIFINGTKEISNYDYSEYSMKSFSRRLQKVLSDNNMSVEALLKKMRKSNKFLETVIKKITVNTTEPFRTPEIWQDLIPIIRSRLSSSQQINIWHPGCSSGQEVYSMFILLYEMGLFHKTRIYGTDLNEDMLEIARSGKYRLLDFDDYWDNFNNSMTAFPDFNLKNYFDISKRRDIVKVKSFLVEKPVFVRHDLIKDKNIFGVKFDIIMCRNVLIYFNHMRQNKIFRFFYENLTENGILVIGKHESILNSLQHKFRRSGSIYSLKKEDTNI